MNLYEHDQIEKELAEMVEQNDGEVTPEIMEQLVIANTDTESKRLKISYFMRDLQTSINAHKEEELRIAKRRKTIENKLKWLKNYLTPYVLEYGKQQVGTFTWSIRRSKQVHVEDNFNLPDYVVEEVKTKPDKKKIKEVLESGIEIPGAEIVTNQNFQFK